MKKINVIIFLLCAGLSFTQDFHKYDMESLNTIPSGTEKNLINTGVLAPGFNSPTAFEIYDGEIWISDSLNNRIAVFDNNFDFKRDYVTNERQFVEKKFGL